MEGSQPSAAGGRPDGGTMAPAEKCRKHGKNGTQRRYWVRVVRTMQWLDHRRHTHAPPRATHVPPRSLSVPLGTRCSVSLSDARGGSQDTHGWSWSRKNPSWPFNYSDVVASEDEEGA